MNGATPKRVTIVPLIAPTPAPTASTMITTAHTGGNSVTSRKPTVSPSSRTPATIPASPTIEPTERSMPPVRITISMPIASSALIATCRVIVTRLS